MNYLNDIGFLARLALTAARFLTVHLLRMCNHSFSDNLFSHLSNVFLIAATEGDFEKTITKYLICSDNK